MESVQYTMCNMRKKIYKKMALRPEKSARKGTYTAEDVREELQNFLVETSRMMRAARKEMRLKHPSLLG